MIGSGESLDIGNLAWGIASHEASHWNDHNCTLEESGGDELIDRAQEDSKTLHHDAVWRFTRADEFDTTKEHVVEILLYAALLSLLMSRELLDLVTEQTDDEIMFPPERWAATFRSHAQLILHELGEYLGYSPPPLLDRLIEDAQKIHQQRPVLQETLATATQPRCES